MQLTWTCFILLGDDIHDIFALINGKIVSFVVQNMQIISAYLLPHPPLSYLISYPAKQPPLPSSEKENHCLFFSWHLSLCPTVCTSQFVIDS